MPKRVGVMDAGIGGLHAMSKIHRRMPDVEIVYIGDGRNQPYTIHSREWISEKAQIMVDFLRERKIDTLVIACHTISSFVELLETYDLQVYDIITPTLQYVKNANQQKHYLFIGTRTTIESGSYHPSWLNEKSTSYIQAIELGKYIERYGVEHPDTEAYIQRLIQAHFSQGIDPQDSIEVVLVCTDYFLVKSLIVKWVKLVTGCSEVGIVEPSLLLADSLSFQETENSGAVEIYLSQDKTGDFSSTLDNVMTMYQIEKEPVYFIDLENML